MKKFIFYLIIFFTAVFSFSSFDNKNLAPAASSANGEIVNVGGQIIGIKARMDGVFVTGVEAGSPADNAGIKTGDFITEIDGVKILEVSELENIINNSNVKLLALTVNGTKMYVQAKFDNHGKKWRIGVWAKDKSDGFGTITFVRNNSTFSAFGHGILGIDNKALYPIASGEIYAASVVGVKPGIKGEAGNINGAYGEKIGRVEGNTNVGVVGIIKGYVGEKAEIAAASEIKKGHAEIISTINGNTPERFLIEIEKIDLNNKNNQQLTLRVVDNDLIKRTGGIVQGMSGSPIMQNGKLIGAITHVETRDPTRGFGISAETLIK